MFNVVVEFWMPQNRPKWIRVSVCYLCKCFTSRLSIEFYSAYTFVVNDFGHRHMLLVDFYGSLRCFGSFALKCVGKMPVKNQAL